MIKKTIICTKENPLHAQISETEKSEIEEIIVSGFLGIEDFHLLTEMSQNDNKLHSLDMSGVSETEFDFYLPLADDYYCAKIGITDDAFVDSVNLQRIVFPEGLEAIGNRAFSGCIHLKDVDFPSKLVIGSLAFQNCPLLEYFYIEGQDGIDYLFGDAFAGSIKRYVCDMNEWPLNDSGKPICPSDFKGCFSFEGAVFNYIEWLGDVDIYMSRYPCGSERKEYVVPNGVDTIKEFAFTKCRDLQQITFPESCVDLTVNAITDCPELNTLIFRSKSLDGRRSCHWDMDWDDIITNCPKLKDIYLFADDPSKVSFYIFASLENIDDIVLHVPSFSAKKYKEVEHDFVRVEEGVLIPPSAYDDMEKTKVKVWQEFKKIEEFDPIDFM